MDTLGQQTPAGPGRRQDYWLTFDMEDGLPHSAVLDLVEEPSGGALWLATQTGTSRFDGQYFETFTSRDGLLDDHITVLCFDRDGVLWVGTRRGLNRYAGGRFETATTKEGLGRDRINTLAPSPDGAVWVGTKSRLCRLGGGRIETFTTKEGLGDNEVRHIALGPDGAVWVGTRRGVSRFDGRHFETFTTAEGLGHNVVHALALGPDGAVWVGTRREISRFDGRRFETFTTAEGLGSDRVRSIGFASDGSLWLGTLRGVSRYDGQRFEHFTTKEGLAHSVVSSVLKTQDGSLWLGTYGGLCRCDLHQVQTFTSQDGLASNGIMAVYYDRTDRLLVATWEGVSYREGERFTPLAAIGEQNVWVLLEDRQGRLWFTSYFSAGVSYYDGTQVKTYTEKDGLVSDRIESIAQDRAGHLWMASQYGVSCFDGETFTNYGAEAGPGLGSVLNICQDRDGVLWFATSDFGLTGYDGRTFTNYTSKDGLVDDRVISVCQDREGYLWLGTASGLSRFDGHTFTNYTSKDGVGKAGILSIFQDRAGHLWFCTRGEGIKRYDGRVFQTLSRAHGLPSNVIQQICQAPEGFFWIATEAGLVRYRPSDKKPRVAITQLIADDSYSPPQRISIADTQQLIQIRFAGGTLRTASGSLVYRYRLQGPPGTDGLERTALKPEVEYRNLPVGAYGFYVQAVDVDMNYSDPARLDFEIVPDPKIQSLTKALNASTTADAFIGESSVLQAVQAQLAAVAPSEVTVLIQGETGTGKGVAARTLHQLSGRASGPFIAVNCGALPEGLVESELFGHEKGAFTGALNRQLGKVELAGGGTLFLDEIGDMSMSAQIRLLHILQEKTFQRVGGSQTLQADIRVVAATNRDLQGMIQAGTFRQDLYFRLQVFPVLLPPLRQRGDDITTLALFFMQQMAAHLQKTITGFSSSALAALAAYAWPGNVRELEHTVQRAVIVCRGPVIEAGDLGLDETVASVEPTALEGMLPPEEYERQYLTQALAQTQGVIRGKQGAAALLGMPVSTLRYRMKKLGLG